jgi:rhodanese-related sulfurtransferase
MTLSVSTDAVAFFASRLAFQTDVADVHAAFASGDPGFVLVDSRGRAGWAQGRIPGAVHLPTAEIPVRAAALLDPGVPVVTYCWGPGCNGATRAALAMARLGYVVREMLGGIEYWTREGFPIETDSGLTHPEPDPLTTPCGC